MGGLEAPAPRQAVRLRPGGFPEAQGRVSAALTGPGHMAVGWSPADNQQLPPRHLDQGCALPRTGGEAGGGSLCPLYRQGAPPPTPSGAESKQGLGGLRPEGEGLCPPSFREGPSESATFLPVCDGWGWGGGGVGQCRASGPLIAQNSSAASPQPPPAGPGTHTLRSSWGGCASLNPLPTLSQSPPEASASWAGPPRPRHHHVRVGSRQPARPWHRAQTVHMGAAHADHTVRARVGGLPACQGHGVRSQPSTSLWRRGVWGRGHLMAGYVLGWGQVPGR